MKCTNPPPGWHCTRDRGHPGPCAAVQDETLTFRLTREQDLEIVEWCNAHDKAKHGATEEEPRYSGSIGGAYTYMFVPTGIGLGVRVSCSCGEEIDVSHYEDW